MPLNRRDFLSAAGLAGGGLLLPNLKPISFNVPAQFELLILATNWGFQGTLEAFCAKAKADEYDGIEIWAPRKKKEQEKLIKSLEKYSLSLGVLVGVGASDFKQHFKEFKAYLEDAIKLKPLFINCHSGRDYFSFDQNRQIIEFSNELATSSGVPIYHETHRARILFAAHISKRFLETIPELMISLDISHWTNVAASLLMDQKKAVDLALSRTRHIHSRVGHQNAPQITDPRAPEWQNVMDIHFAWWDKVVQSHINLGKRLTMTTEFGPPNYMAALPFTQQPITNLWEINNYMKDLWRKRYQ